MRIVKFIALCGMLFLFSLCYLHLVGAADMPDAGGGGLAEVYQYGARAITPSSSNIDGFYVNKLTTTDVYVRNTMTVVPSGGGTAQNITYNPTTGLWEFEAGISAPSVTADEYTENTGTYGNPVKLKDHSYTDLVQSIGTVGAFYVKDKIPVYDLAYAAGTYNLDPFGNKVVTATYMVNLNNGTSGLTDSITKTFCFAGASPSNATGDATRSYCTLINGVTRTGFWPVSPMLRVRPSYLGTSDAPYTMPHYPFPTGYYSPTDYIELFQDPSVAVGASKALTASTWCATRTGYYAQKGVDRWQWVDGGIALNTRNIVNTAGVYTAYLKGTALSGGSFIYSNESSAKSNVLSGLPETNQGCSLDFTTMSSFELQAQMDIDFAANGNLSFGFYRTAATAGNDYAFLKVVNTTVTLETKKAGVETHTALAAFSAQLGSANLYKIRVNSDGSVYVTDGTQSYTSAAGLVTYANFVDVAPFLLFINGGATTSEITISGIRFKYD